MPALLNEPRSTKEYLALAKADFGIAKLLDMISSYGVTGLDDLLIDLIEDAVDDLVYKTGDGRELEKWLRDFLTYRLSFLALGYALFKKQGSSSGLLFDSTLSLQPADKENYYFGTAYFKSISAVFPQRTSIAFECIIGEVCSNGNDVLWLWYPDLFVLPLSISKAEPFLEASADPLTWPITQRGWVPNRTLWDKTCQLNEFTKDALERLLEDFVNSYLNGAH